MSNLSELIKNLKKERGYEGNKKPSTHSLKLVDILNDVIPHLERLNRLESINIHDYNKDDDSDIKKMTNNKAPRTVDDLYYNSDGTQAYNVEAYIELMRTQPMNLEDLKSAQEAVRKYPEGSWDYSEHESPITEVELYTSSTPPNFWDKSISSNAPIKEVRDEFKEAVMKKLNEKYDINSDSDEQKGDQL